MDFSGVNDAMASMNFQQQQPNSDMSWLDWEHIMDDLSEMPPMNINMGSAWDLSQPVMSGTEWSGTLDGDLA